MSSRKTLSSELPQPRREIVIAPPGCGKTEHLASEIADLLVGKDGDEGVDPGSILCITFTDQASAEMEERVRHYLRKRKGPHPVLPCISTLHAFCLQHLGVGGKNIVIIDDNHFQEFASQTDPDDPGRMSLHDFNRENWNPNRPEQREIPEQMVIQKAFLMSRGVAFRGVRRWSKAHNDLLEYYTRRYLRYKEELNRSGKARYLDFNDILLQTKKAIDAGDWDASGSYPLVFVDEVQDLTALQLEIAESLVSPGGCIRFFGDPQQAIYGFMGARVENLIRLSSTCGKKSFRRINHRSPDYLLEGLNRYAEEYLQPEPEWKSFCKGWQQIPSSRMKGVPRGDYATAVLHASCFDREIEGIMERINSYPLTESNVILARDNARVRRVISALKQKRCYLILDSDGREHTYFLRLLSTHIAVCLDHDDREAWIRLLPLVTRSEQRMTALSIVSRLDSFSLSPLDLMMGTVPHECSDGDARDAFLGREGMKMLAHKLSIQYRPLFERTRDDIDNLRRTEGNGCLNRNITGRLEAWYAAFVDAGFLAPGFREEWHAACGMILKMLHDDFPGEPSGGERRETERRLRRACYYMRNSLGAEIILSRTNTSLRMVSVMTIHQAKGRGFDNVFLFEARDDVFPPSYRELARLFYVGITRAKKRLILTLTDGQDFLEDVRDGDLHPRPPQDAEHADGAYSPQDIAPEELFWEREAEEAFYIPEDPDDSFYPSHNI